MVTSNRQKKHPQRQKRNVSNEDLLGRQGLLDSRFMEVVTLFGREHPRRQGTYRGIQDELLLIAGELHARAEIERKRIVKELKASQKNK